MILCLRRCKAFLKLLLPEPLIEQVMVVFASLRQTKQFNGMWSYRDAFFNVSYEILAEPNGKLQV